MSKRQLNSAIQKRLWYFKPLRKPLAKRTCDLEIFDKPKTFSILFFFKTMTFVSNFLPALGKRKLKRSVLFWANSKRIKNLLFSVKTLEPKKVVVFFFFPKKRNKHRNFFGGTIVPQKTFCSKNFAPLIPHCFAWCFLVLAKKKKREQKSVLTFLYILW